jgi:DNA-binding CsgD family transcriptional regulator
MESSASNLSPGIPLNVVDIDDLIQMLDDRSVGGKRPTDLIDEAVLQLEVEGVRYLVVRCSPGIDRLLDSPNSPANVSFALTAGNAPPETSTRDECPEETRRPLAGDPVLGRTSRPAPPLSPREIEIARMVAKGYADKSIAAILEISKWTVSSHLRRIYIKLGVKSRAAMVARLLEGPRNDQS